MAKLSALGATLGIDDSGGDLRQIQNDVTALTFNTDRGSVDVTGIDKSAVERLSLRADGTVSITLEFNTASDRSFDVFKDTSGTRTFTLIVQSQTLSMEMGVDSVGWAVGADGRFQMTVGMSLKNGTVPVWS